MVAQLDVSRGLAADVDPDRNLADLDDQSRCRPEETAVGNESLPLRANLDGDVLGTQESVDAV